MLRHRSLVMVFSDLLSDYDATVKALRRLRHGGHDVILFHILDEAEVTFPFSGSVDLLEPESQDHEIVDAQGIRAEYLQALEEMREKYRATCLAIGADYVPLDTSMPFDKALVEYLSQRQARF
mgnify:CR=1 FL=1